MHFSPGVIWPLISFLEEISGLWKVCSRLFILKSIAKSEFNLLFGTYLKIYTELFRFLRTGAFPVGSGFSREQTQPGMQQVFSTQFTPVV